MLAVPTAASLRKLEELRLIARDRALSLAPSSSSRQDLHTIHSMRSCDDLPNIQAYANSQPFANRRDRSPLYGAFFQETSLELFLSYFKSRSPTRARVPKP